MTRPNRIAVLIGLAGLAFAWWTSRRTQGAIAALGVQLDARPFNPNIGPIRLPVEADLPASQVWDNSFGDAPREYVDGAYHPDMLTVPINSTLPDVP